MHHSAHQPRFTPFYRDQAHELGQARKEALSDPDIHAQWLSALQYGTGLHQVGSRLDESACLRLERLHDATINALQMVIEARAPKVVHALNSSFGLGSSLREWLLDILAGIITGHDWRPGAKQYIQRFFPDNPAERRSDGQWFGIDEATRAHHDQLAEYKESLMPVGKPGRPHGSGITAEEFR